MHKSIITQRESKWINYPSEWLNFEREGGSVLAVRVAQLKRNDGSEGAQYSIEKAGVPKIRFHDLRHTCATLLLSQEVNPKIVQERLGHSDISMTLNRYSHVTPTMQDKAAQILGDVLEI